MILTGLLLACLPLAPFADDVSSARPAFSDPGVTDLCVIDATGGVEELISEVPPVLGDDDVVTDPAADPNGSGSGAGKEVDEAAAPPGAFRRFFHDHGWHLVV